MSDGIPTPKTVNVMAPLSPMNFAFASLVGMLFLCLTSGCRTDEAGAPVDVGKALAHIHLDSHSSYLSELRRLGHPISDFQEEVKAAAIDPKSYRPVSVVSHIRVGNRPLLWFAPKQDGVVVDKNVFTDLKAVRAVTARYLDAKGQAIGRFLAGSALSPRRIVEFLIKGDIIRSNRHVTAEVYLMAESSDETGYQCHIVCVDTYYTNQKNVDTYKYGVRISKDGEIRMMKD